MHPGLGLTGQKCQEKMSAFARHEDSIPVIGDIGMIWPVFAVKIADELGIKLDFISYKQETEEGR